MTLYSTEISLCCRVHCRINHLLPDHIIFGLCSVQSDNFAYLLFPKTIAYGKVKLYITHLSLWFMYMFRYTPLSTVQLCSVSTSGYSNVLCVIRGILLITMSRRECTSEMLGMHESGWLLVVCPAQNSNLNHVKKNHILEDIHVWEQTDRQKRYWHRGGGSPAHTNRVTNFLTILCSIIYSVITWVNTSALLLSIGSWKYVRLSVFCRIGEEVENQGWQGPLGAEEYLTR